MTNLLRKEILLCLHPTAPMFLALSAMLLIPSYPYLVIFFYTVLAIFFTCINGRENNDVYYTLALPVKKSGVVKSRFILVMLLELAQIVIAIPFAFLRQAIYQPPNDAGMDASIALFGFVFIMLGIFNLVFFSGYYKDVSKVGKPFVISCIAMFVYIGAVETAAHAVPFVRDCLDTPDPQFVSYKLVVLALGAVIYAALTAVSYVKSQSSFEKQDL